VSATPWAGRGDVAPPMPEIVKPGMESHGLRRLRRYANLVKRSIHLKFWLACALSRLLPDFASGIIRARIYRWAGFEIGDGAFLMGNLRLKSASPGFYGKLSIGEGATLANEITINLDGEVTIGKNVAIAPHVVIYTGSHQIGPGSKRIGAFTALPVTIEEGAWIRVGAILVPGVTVGRGSIVAAGAVVLKDVPPNTYVEGNPAQVVRQLPWGYR
jgi:maltose O-acetyltransferase